MIFVSLYRLISSSFMTVTLYFLGTLHTSTLRLHYDSGPVPGVVALSSFGFNPRYRHKGAVVVLFIADAGI